MESAINDLVTVFQKYASGDKSLGKKKFRELVQMELKNFLTDAHNKKAVNKLCVKLDQNKDGTISFQEYWNLVSDLAISKHELTVNAAGS